MKDNLITLTDIAKEFNVTKEAISRISRGETWKYLKRDHVYIAYRKREIKLIRHNFKRKLSENKVLEIKGMIHRKLKLIDIARHFKVSPNTIADIKHGRLFA